MAIQQQSSNQDMSLTQAIEMVAKDKGIDKTRLVKTVEEAILKAAQSAFGPTRELEARFNEDTGQVDLFQYMTVVDDVDPLATDCGVPTCVPWSLKVVTE